MRRAIAFITLGIITILPAAVSAGSLDLRAGAFFPRADSNLFIDDSVLYGHDGHPLDKGDWDGFTAGMGYNAILGRYAELGFNLDYFRDTQHTSYNDFVTAEGREIQQDLRLQIVPVGVTFRLVPTSRGRLAPYIGIGADAIFYDYDEFGDFVDFDDPTQPIIPDAFHSSGVAPGFHVEGGLRVPIGDDFSIVAGARYQWADDDMGEDFRGNRIDLSGTTATLGINLRF